MGEMHGSARSSSLAFRFKVKGAGVLVFFLLASLYSWWVPGSEVVVIQHRGLLEALDPQKGAQNDTSRYADAPRSGPVAGFLLSFRLFLDDCRRHRTGVFFY